MEKEKEDCFFTAIVIFWEEVIDPGLSSDDIVNMLSFLDDPVVYEEVRQKLGDKVMAFLKAQYEYNKQVVKRAEEYERRYLHT